MYAATGPVGTPLYRAILTLTVANILALIIYLWASHISAIEGNAIKVIFLASGVTMYVYELHSPRTNWPPVRMWQWRAFSFTTVQALIVYYSGSLWDNWLLEKRPWDIGVNGSLAGTLVAFLVMTLVSYWQHRIKHMIPFLWRYLHQIHHSPRRLELLTSFYRNPLEIFLNMFIMSAVLYLVVGSTRLIAADTVLLLGLADMFYHWNVRTPRWLGYLIQRPEAHCVHHCQGVHAYNFGDLAIWDMLFGTFRNPLDFRGECGFPGNGEEQLLEMVIGHDMSFGKHLYEAVRTKTTDTH
ncbi:MAG TPA: sterol desaturase family protein [Aromatoleum sp.]|uniref:sterol desaturase family protein n=1 Tax=Aromatoleum sp. TaxID=2307007 RepID=UPI002B47CC99|nr:sterol desaturase family protein [Aromatoleum sp.]HJV25203.1 sterol desaturase family protein [Aromatoleum sp.]